MLNLKPRAMRSQQSRRDRCEWP